MFGSKRARTFPRWGWEKSLRVGYLHLANGGIKVTQQFSTPSGHVFLDFDEQGKVVGVEVML